MIVSLGGDVKPLALFPTIVSVLLVGDVKDPIALVVKSRGCSPRCLWSVLFKLREHLCQIQILIVNCISSLAKSPGQCCEAHLIIYIYRNCAI